jgi:hypothetical protein
MSSSNPSRFLDGSSDWSLSLTQFWGGCVEAFRDETILFGGSEPAIDTKVISQGKNHQFLMMADTPDPENHTPGDELLGQQFELQDGTITVDDILVAHHDVPLDQMLLSPVDIVAKLSRKVGEKLAREYDQRMFNLAVTAARTAGVTKNGLNVHNGGNRVEAVNGSGVAAAFPVSSAGAIAFRAKVAELAQSLDEDFVPEGGRNLYITPYIRRVLGQDTTIFDRDYTRNPRNDLNSRTIGEMEGFNVIVAKGRIPSTNITKYTGTPAKYNVDARFNGATGEPVAIALCGATQGMAALGVVQAMGIMSKMKEDDRRNTLFVKGQMYIGAGVLHPWCAGSIEVDDA